MPPRVRIRDLLVHDSIYIIRGRIKKSKTEVLYIGKAGKQSVTDRLRMHINRGRRAKKTRIAELIVEAGENFLDWTVEILSPKQWGRHGEDLNSAEKALIQIHCPKCNRQHMPSDVD